MSEIRRTANTLLKRQFDELVTMELLILQIPAQTEADEEKYAMFSRGLEREIVETSMNFGVDPISLTAMVDAEAKRRNEINS